jgi:hypothetical protein
MTIFHANKRSKKIGLIVEGNADQNQNVAVRIMRLAIRVPRITRSYRVDFEKMLFLVSID